MGLFSFVADLRATQLIDELAQQLSRQTYGLLHDICQPRVALMTHAEARGYVWAKARPIVLAQVTVAAQAHPDLGRLALSTLSERAHDRVVRSVLSDLMRERAQLANRRRAA
jgi:hypothetical protein